MLKSMAIAVALLSCVAHASAEMVEKTGRFGGMPVTYKVVLPAGYDAARTYPVVLVFTGGAQQLRGAENTLNADWRTEAEKRGYKIKYTVEKNQAHRLRAQEINLSARLFDEIESCK